MTIRKLAITMAIAIGLCIDVSNGNFLEQEGAIHSKNATQIPSSFAQHKAGLNASMMAKEPKWEFKPYFDDLSEHGPFFGELDQENQTNGTNGTNGTNSTNSTSTKSRRKLSDQEYMLRGKNASIKANDTIKFAFVNDLHLEPNYTKIRNDQYQKAKDAKLLTVKEGLDKLDPTSKKFVQKFFHHVLSQLKDISELYVTQKSYANNHTQWLNYTEKVMNVEIKQKIWDTQMFLQKGRELDLANLEAIRDFLKNEFYTSDWRVATLLPYESCQLLTELTGSGDFGKCTNDMGIYGFDAPKKLIEYIIEHLKEKHSDADVIVLDGDFIAHDHAGGHGMTDDEKAKVWSALKGILNDDMAMLRKQFPGKVLLPTIGNNDVVIHNSVPCNEDDAETYYKELFEIWFPEGERPPNFDLATANETFSNGGYYRYDFANSSLSFIALNTMYYNKKNHCMLEKGEQQLIWFDALMKNNSASQNPRQFVLGMHVFPGLNDFNGVEQFWHENYTSQFLNFVTQHQDSIQLISGAHIHRSQLRGPQSSVHHNLAVPLLVTTSITPVYSNNPGFTTLEIKLNSTIGKSKHFEFGPLIAETFQLQYYMLFGAKAWTQQVHKDLYGLDINDYKSLRSLPNFIQNSMDLGAFDGYNAGFDKYVSEAIYGFVFYPLYIEFVDKDDLSVYLCSLMWYEQGQGFDDCRNKLTVMKWKV